HGSVNNVGHLVLTIAVAANGDVTLTQDRSVKEGSAETPDASEGISLTSGLVTLTATVTDNDGDKALASVDVGSHATFHDDGPTNIIPGLDVLLNAAGTS